MNDRDTELLGLRYGAVEVVPHRPEWRACFEAERQRLAAVIALGVAIEHVGSTAVADLLAKPILDLALGLPEGLSFEVVRTALEGAGYLYRGDKGDDGGHVFVRGPRPDLRTHHLHVVPLAGRQWREYLALRQHLRRSEAARRRYDAIKRQLAEQHAGDRGAYTAGKGEVVEALLGEAAAVEER
ncbi:MAG: GrpB family protein [Nannocystaceae bacterium]